MAGTSYNKAETALTEAKKIHIVLTFRFAVRLQSQSHNFFSHFLCKYLVVKMGSFKVKMHQN